MLVFNLKHSCFLEKFWLYLDIKGIIKGIIKGTVMQIKKALINDCLRVSKASWKFRIPTIYNFTVIYQWNLPFSWKVVSIAFSVYKQNFTANNLKTRTAMNAKISVFFICVETIIYFFIYNLHDCTFNVNIRHPTSLSTGLIKFCHYALAHPFPIQPFFTPWKHVLSG